MSAKFLTILFVLVLIQVGSQSISAQIDASSRNGRSQPEEIPQNIKESLAKQRIAQEKKEYEELINRSAEAVSLSEDLQNAFNASTRLNSESIKKLEKLEKLVKKIRSELGGSNDEEDSDDDDEKIPTTSENAFTQLKEATAKLNEEVKKSSRYSVSAVAIQSSNTVLKIVKFIRSGM